MQHGMDGEFLNCANVNFTVSTSDILVNCIYKN